MKKSLFLALCVVLVSCSLVAKTQKEEYRVAVAGKRMNCPVVIHNVPLWALSAVVTSNGMEIDSQIDKPLHELAFVADIDSSRDFQVVYSSKPATKNYRSRVHAQMWLKNPDKSLVAADTVASDKDDMYNKLHHHGPAFESEYAAYRIYFDKKQTIDTYGKKTHQLELADAKWYPSDEQMRRGYGYDNLRVFGTTGVGTLKGWDAEKGEITHIADFKRREARILARGPVRAIVEMRVEGWNYCGREINMTSRYIIYAGHSDVQVENTIEGDFKELVFATGVMKMARNKMLRADNGVAAFGSDYPENDTLKWQRESVGLAVAVSPRRICSQTDDAKNYLFQLTPDSRGRIDYVLEMIWRRSNWLDRLTDDECLIALLDEVGQSQTSVTVARTK